MIVPALLSLGRLQLFGAEPPPSSTTNRQTHNMASPEVILLSDNSPCSGSQNYRISTLAIKFKPQSFMVATVALTRRLASFKKPNNFLFVTLKWGGLMGGAEVRPKGEERIKYYHWIKLDIIWHNQTISHLLEATDSGQEPSNCLPWKVKLKHFKLFDVVTKSWG